MKLDLNFELDGLDVLSLPKEVELDNDAKHAGKLLSSLLMKAIETENPIKFFHWALELYKQSPIEIDKQDVELLKKFVKGHQHMFVIAKAQILNKLNELKQA